MKQILLVDDDPENRESVIGFLNIKSEEINVLVASNGRQAVDIAKKKKLDLIIMDWDMPVMNGIEAIKQIKKIPECIGIPIIMFTGIRTASEDLQEALTAGAIDFLRKPVDNVELRARINSMLLLTDYFNDKIAAESRNTELLKEKSENELHFKEKELQAMTLAMVSKNQAFLDIRSNIVKIAEVETMSPTMKEHCSKILSKIDSNIQDTDYWEEFKNRFSLLHTGFIEKIQNQFSDLSGNDIKLCCFLKMNMSNKEIAQVLNSSLDAVDKSRYRLRKKLNLESDTNITQFLNKIN